MTSPLQHHYAVLGIKQSATLEEIKSGYRRQVKRYHPDQAPGDAQALAKFLAIQEAYRLLSEEKQREPKPQATSEAKRESDSKSDSKSDSGFHWYREETTSFHAGPGNFWQASPSRYRPYHARPPVGLPGQIAGCIVLLSLLACALHPGDVLRYGGHWWRQGLVSLAHFMSASAAQRAKE